MVLGQAARLNNEALALSAAHRHEQARALIRRAADACELLAEEHPGTYAIELINAGCIALDVAVAAPEPLARALRPATAHAAPEHAVLGRNNPRRAADKDPEGVSAQFRRLSTGPQA
ncbi:hypothetical protein HD597_003566 [Nonomuraea thailandensis]|uniref:Uncharacterized protein n=1 Tax=Nonomuraea thailandensis TaxID=1188745 RepID=A0A9X2K4F2_9ACTN|nr:hypothetical protein [Nonomuraea thailandensis]MCP2356546.1 hypothetical protein [Nonomuraea thailandensis]